MGKYNQVKAHIQHYKIVRGAISDQAIYLFTESYYDPEIHGDSYNSFEFPQVSSIYRYLPLPSKLNNEWGAVSYDDIYEMNRIAILPSQLIGVFFEGSIISLAHNTKNIAEDIALSVNEIPEVVNDVTVIDKQVYVASVGGRVFKRIADKKWQEFARVSTQKTFAKKKKIEGFNCIEGFSAEEIYAGGHKGSLWLYENQSWRPIELPTNKDVKQIVCAPDGYVYLSCGSRIIKGRKDQWQVIKFAIEEIARISWFQDSLYVLPNFASVHGLFTLNERKFNRVNVSSWPIDPDKVINDNLFLGLEVKNENSEVFIPGGMNDMVASDDLLMITGNEEVILFNGERWFNLFDKNRTEEELRATGTFYDPREL